jgi:MFS family permease
MLDGLAVAREWPAIGALLVAFGLSNFFSAPLLLYLPRYADLFGVGARGLGFLEAALAAGMLAASLALLIRRDPLGPRVVAPLSLGAIGILMAVLGRVAGYPAFLAGLAGIGFALGMLNVTVVAYFQRTVPGERIGRFMGLLTAVVYAAPALGFGLMGTIASTAHPGPYVTAQGLCVVAVATGLAAILSRGSRGAPSSCPPTAS